MSLFIGWSLSPQASTRQNAKNYRHSSEACAGYRVKPGTSFFDPVAGVQKKQVTVFNNFWMPACAGMTKNAFILEFFNNLLEITSPSRYSN
ncbi:MAG: hypothetical protein V3S12_06315 [Acidiferrobacterales bacterium]